MKKITNVKILEKVTDFYFSSKDFNGIPLSDLYQFVDIEEAVFKETLVNLINKREVDLIYEGDIPNPHIKPFPAPPIDKQIEKIQKTKIDDNIKSIEENAETINGGETKITLFFDSIGCCVYPTPERLRKIVDWRRYASRPFTLRLAMGEYQLRPYFFELGILAVYRNDPRYRYSTDDITGSLYSVEGDLLNPSDRIFLKHFYFGFDNNGVRAVAVLLGDLTRLTPEHQQIWKAKMLRGHYKFGLHPDARKGILGHFPDKCSIFTAFLEELRVINEMAVKIKGVSLLKEVFGEKNKPENFGFLILPTLREFDLFCHTLDRMMNDNINEDFFDGEIKQEDLDSRETLKEIKGYKIRKLNLWITKKFRLPDPKPKDDMIKTLKYIRGLRSKPAHAHYVNKWDLSLYRKQRKLVKRAYTAMRVLRLILTNDLRARAVEVPKWLHKGEIRTF